MAQSLTLISKVKGKKKFHPNNMVLLIPIASILLLFDFGHAVKKRSSTTYIATKF